MKNLNRFEEKFCYFILLLLLFAPPFLRGLYFDVEFLIYHIFTAIIFIVFVYTYKKNNQNVSLLDLPIVLLFVAYCLALFGALNFRNAVGEIFKYFNYFMIYFLIREFSHDQRKIKTFLFTLYFGGIIESLIGLIAAFGTINITGAYIDNRISSTLGYSNALGGYLIPILLIGTYLYINEKVKNLKLIYVAGNYLVLVTILGSVSRGALLVMPIALVLYFLLTPKGFKIQYAVSTIFPLICAIIVGSTILPSSSEYGQVVKWSILLVGILISIGLGYLMEVILTRFRLEKRIMIFAGILLFIGIAGTVTYFQGSQTDVKKNNVKLIPSNVAQRMESLGLEDRNVRERIVFYKDSLKIIKDHPFLGTGGGGWAAVYNKYQSYAYFTTKTHSHFFQVWVEAGILGLLSYLLLWLTPIIMLVKILRLGIEKEQRILIVTLFTAIIAILIHSLIDFNLSLGASAIVFWALLAMLGSSSEIASSASSSRYSFQINAKIFRITSLATGLIILVFSASLLMGLVYGQAGAKNIRQWKLKEARQNMERARLFDPINAFYVADLAQILHYTGDPVDDFEMVRKAKNYAEVAKRLASTNVDVMIIKSKIHLSLSEFPETMAELEEAVAMFPYDNQAYENLSETYLKIGKFYLAKGKKEEANKYFHETTKIPPRIEKRLSKLTAEDKTLWNATEMLVISPRIKNDAAEAVALLKISK
ncbi:MAG: O-antigen ligase family protein [Clostridia bacterium]|nr:O-antigen ligase family protein [Clostridia bacterium]